jgi:hypothetical protein
MEKEGTRLVHSGGDTTLTFLPPFMRYSDTVCVHALFVCGIDLRQG